MDTDKANENIDKLIAQRLLEITESLNVISKSISKIQSYSSMASYLMLAKESKTPKNAELKP